MGVENLIARRFLFRLIAAGPEQPVVLPILHREERERNFCRDDVAELFLADSFPVPSAPLHEKGKGDGFNLGHPVGDVQIFPRFSNEFGRVISVDRGMRPIDIREAPGSVEDGDPVDGMLERKLTPRLDRFGPCEGLDPLWFVVWKWRDTHGAINCFSDLIIPVRIGL